MTKFILTFAFLLGCAASAEEIAPAADKTEGDSTAIRACFGSCDSNSFQRLINENPEKAKAKYQEIFGPGTGVIHPDQLKGNATHDDLNI